MIEWRTATSVTWNRVSAPTLVNFSPSRFSIEILHEDLSRVRRQFVISAEASYPGFRTGNKELNSWA